MLFPETSNNRKLLLPLVLTAQEELVSWKASEIQEPESQWVEGVGGRARALPENITQWNKRVGGDSSISPLVISDLSLVAPLGLIQPEACQCGDSG